MSTYRFREQPLQGLSAGGGMTYVGERNGDLFRPFDVPAYTRFDAFIAYRLNDRIQFSLDLENLTDKDYLNSADTGAVFPGAPFSVFGRVELRL